jgi:hypothetical protein
LRFVLSAAWRALMTRHTPLDADKKDKQMLTIKPKPSPFSPRTGIQADIDAVIERLVELRQSEIACTRSLFDDEAAELRTLADLARSAADAFDPLMRRIAYIAGVSSLSGAGEYDRITFKAIDGDLLDAITSRAERLEEAAAPREDQRSEHSTLNHRQLGLKG